MTMSERAANYSRVFPKRPPLQIVQEAGRDVVYGVFLIGADYKNKTTFYGSYPVGYLDRVYALFPDIVHPQRLNTDLLHVFSGSLPPGNYERCDSVQPAELQCSVYNLPNIILNWRPKLVIADPPYSAADATEYSTPMINRGRALRALAQVTDPGRHLVWLDTCWPMFRKDQWRTVGRITVIRSTNHRVRQCSIFERTATTAVA